MRKHIVVVWTIVDAEVVVSRTVVRDMHAAGPYGRCIHCPNLLEIEVVPLNRHVGLLLWQ